MNINLKDLSHVFDLSDLQQKIDLAKDKLNELSKADYLTVGEHIEWYVDTLANEERLYNTGLMKIFVMESSYDNINEDNFEVLYDVIADELTKLLNIPAGFRLLVELSLTGEYDINDGLILILSKEIV